MKFGILYQNAGKWGKQQIVESDWVTESMDTHITRSRADNGYGYQFWTWTDSIKGSELDIVAAIGNGDQRIFFDQKHNLLVVVTAGNYNKWDIENNAHDIFESVVESIENN